MHVLVIPSEEFQPPGNHLSGIFQLHQVRALAEEGIETGVLSIRLSLSIPMILRSAAARLSNRPRGNSLDGSSITELAAILYRKLLRQSSTIRLEHEPVPRVMRIEGFYYLPPSPSSYWFGWVRAGLSLFDEYCNRFGTPDVVHAHNINPAGLLAHEVFARRKVPFVVTEHSSEFMDGRVRQGPVKRMKGAAKAASALFAVSPALAAAMSNELSLQPGTVRQLPNVLDQLFVDTPLRARHHNDKGLRFLSIGELKPVKNHETLIRAFHHAFGRESTHKLMIAGDGPLAGILMDLVKELRLERSIVFLGNLSRDEVLDGIDNCDALVLPSIAETFGVVLIEALSRGRPVIATDCGGPSSIVMPEDGLIIGQSMDALSAALIEMSERIGSYDPAEIRNRALKRFGSDTVVGELRDVYERACRHG